MTPRDRLLMAARDDAAELIAVTARMIDIYAEAVQRTQAIQPLLMSEVWHEVGLRYGKLQRDVAAWRLKGDWFQDSNPMPTTDLVERAMTTLDIHLGSDVVGAIVGQALLRDFASFAVGFYEALYQVTAGEKLPFQQAYREMADLVHQRFVALSDELPTTRCPTRRRTSETVRIAFS